MQTGLTQAAYPRFSASSATRHTSARPVHHQAPATQGVKFSGAGTWYAGSLLGFIVGIIGLFSSDRADINYSREAIERPLTSLQELAQIQKRAGTSPATFSPEFSDRCKSVMSSAMQRVSMDFNGGSLYQYSMPWRMSPQETATFQGLCAQAAEATNVRDLKPLFDEVLVKIIAPHIENPKVDLQTVRQAGFDLFDKMTFTNQHLGKLFGLMVLFSLVAFGVAHTKATVAAQEAFVEAYNTDPAFRAYVDQPSTMDLAYDKFRRWLEK